MPLAAMFGSGAASSSDGQNFPLDRRAQASSAINPHKGSDPAVSFCTHVSDRYAPFHSRVISVGASEAAHVLDGLLHHGADLAIERHHNDGAAFPIMSSRYVIRSGSASRHAFRTSPPGACARSPTFGPDRKPLRSRHSRSTRR